MRRSGATARSRALGPRARPRSVSTWVSSRARVASGGGRDSRGLSVCWRARLARAMWTSSRAFCCASTYEPCELSIRSEDSCVWSGPKLGATAPWSDVGWEPIRVLLGGRGASWHAIREIRHVQLRWVSISVAQIIDIGFDSPSQNRRNSHAASDLVPEVRPASERGAAPDFPIRRSSSTRQHRIDIVRIVTP